MGESNPFKFVTARFCDLKCQILNSSVQTKRSTSTRTLTPFWELFESLDTSTPAGKMAFTVLGAVAELERSLIVERVKAGLRNARAKGKRLGCPRKILDTKRIAARRAESVGRKRIAGELEVGVGTLYRLMGGLEIHMRLAEQYQIKDGDWVTVTSR
jgi:DNA invertase Pin-like site-specific DNA recombinase